MSRREPAFEYGVVIVAFLIILAITLATQERINVNGGRGYDGATYYDSAEQLAAGAPPSGVLRFASRVGTPLLAAIVDPDDLINGFQIVNLSAAFVSTLLFLAWLRRYLDTPWLRVALVLVYASHWLQLVRFTVFYPVLVDACAQALCFAGLNCIASYERAASARKLAAIATISAVGVAFRDVVLLIPLAFLFAGHARRFRAWIPLALAIAAFAIVRKTVTATDPLFSTSTHLLERALSRSALSYLVGWLVAFGPGLFIVLFDWRTAATFFARHRWALVYIAGVAAAGWAGSLESERHALNWGAPIVYLLIGVTIQRHVHWFRGALLAVTIGSQALVSRLFWTIPQPTEDYQQYTPSFVLTPLGSGTTYLHLFPDYVPRSLAWLQLWQYAALGGVILALMWWRAVEPRPGLSLKARLYGALAEARRTSVDAARSRVTRLRRLRARDVVWVLIVFVTAGGLAGAALVQAYRAQPIRINVRWKGNVGSGERKRLERQLNLVNASESEGTTWEYVLTDPSEENVRAIVRHPAVDDTEHLDRELFRPDGADEREQRAWAFGILIGLLVAMAGRHAAKVIHPRASGSISARPVSESNRRRR